MTIKDCPNCGGTHYGSLVCPYIEASCVVCGDATIMACSDCAINSGGKKSVHVCNKSECRDAHEKEQHPKSAPRAEAQGANMSIYKTLEVIKAIAPWRAKHKGQSASEVIECPVCKGQLHLSISKVNGHVHGRCETPDCVAWME